MVRVEADRLSLLVDPHNLNEPLLSGLFGAGNEADLLLLLRATKILSLGLPGTRTRT